MTYKKVYPSKLIFEPKGNDLIVHSIGKTKYKPDLWGIKYLFDKGMGNIPVSIHIKDEISKTMALRMYYLKYIFPHIEFHDDNHDNYINNAEEIINNIKTKYVTYLSKDAAFNDRGTKDKLESRIETELADNLPTYLADFSPGVKVIRQFPANIFNINISEKTRITDKLWIDMVSVNTAGELSPIELKVGGNIPLDLFAQGLDYGIYCHLLKENILDNWFKRVSGTAQEKITIYYIGEAFHPALIGRDSEKGIVSLISKNKYFDIVFAKIAVDKQRQHIMGKSEVILDTRKQ